LIPLLGGPVTHYRCNEAERASSGTAMHTFWQIQRYRELNRMCLFGKEIQNEQSEKNLKYKYDMHYAFTHRHTHTHTLYIDSFNYPCSKKHGHICT